MKIIKKSLLNNSNAYLQGYIRSADASSQHYKFPAVIIVPGGSYTHISPQQAESFALAFAAQGFQSFFLRYSFEQEKHPLMPFPLWELAKSVDLIHDHALEWNVDVQKIVLAGFSIGGHIVSLFNNQYDQPQLRKAIQARHSLKPAATILSYPVIDLTLGFPKSSDKIADWTNDQSQIATENGVTNTNVPTFIWHTDNDPFVPSLNAFKYAEALHQHQVDNELHIFHNGPHGLGLANQLTAWNDQANDPHVAHWFPLAIEWLNNVLN